MFLNLLGRFKYLTEIAQYSSVEQIIFNRPQISDLNKLIIIIYAYMYMFMYISFFLSFFIPILLFKGLVTRTRV